MEQIILAIARKGDQLLRVVGNITNFQVDANANSLTVLHLVMNVADSEIVTGQSATQVITLDYPNDFGGVKGVIRIGGTRKVEIDKDSLTAEFRVISFHSSYEDAAAVIMREKLEKE